MSAMHTIHWGSAQNGIYTLLLVPVIILLAYRFWRSYTVIRVLTQFGAHKFLHNASLLKLFVRSALYFLAFLFLCLALMRPQWNKKEQIVMQEGRDLFIALDISGSMLATDMSPNRLEFAKKKIKALVNSLSSERVGLILFSGSTFVQCPLTSDYGAFFMFLDQVDTQTISSGTTAIDKAIAQALEAFASSSNKKNKLLVLVTDGEDFSTNLSQLKQQAHDQGMIIFTVGIGTATGAPIPLYDQQGKQQGHQKDKNGAVVISRLNEALLQTVAADVGGMYLHATPNAADIGQLVKKLERIEKEKNEEKKWSAYEDQYPLFLLVTFIALCLEWIL